VLTPQRLQSLFRPRAIAIVGASDKSLFSSIAVNNLTAAGFGDRLHLVNRRGVPTHGRETVTTCADLPAGVDVAFLMVPQGGTADALREAAAAGIGNAVVLSSGYAEAGPAGRAAQEELLRVARELDVVVLGPNHLGFVNVTDSIPVTSIPGLPTTAGPVGLVAQSGATASSMLEFADLMAVRFSHVVTTGNEAMVTASDVLDFLVDDEQTRAIALFVETFREPQRLLRALSRARAAGKAVVVLKLGTSELSARTAVAHTGALVGDDKVIDAVLRQYGAIRVDSVEDLLLTANLAAHTGPLARPGVGITSISGGACDVVADRAQDLGMSLTTLTDETVAELAALLPSYGTPHNPLDVTGAAVIDPGLFTTTAAAVGRDPGVGIVGTIFDLPSVEPPGGHGGGAMCRAIAAGLAASPVPGVVINQTLRPVTPYTERLMADYGLPFLIGGLRHAVVALAGIGRWSDSLRRPAVEGSQVPVPVPPAAERTGAWSEVRARELLEAAGVPVVPGVLVHSADEAVAAAQEHASVAVKLVSPDVLHKSDLGAVLLGVTGPEAVREAYDTVLAAAQKQPDAAVEGVLVSPMRDSAVELVVGVVRDAEWGPVLAVGLGGVFVEVLADAALRLLPVDRADVADMLGELRGRAVLDGVRGSGPVDREALVDAVHAVARLAEALGDDLESLEVNPLRADAAGVEALDALVTWRAR
jgi:acyl-CoA synthetase (NDP forming)